MRFSVVLLVSLVIHGSSASVCNSTCVGQLEREYIDSLQNKILSALQLRAPPNVAPPMMSEDEIKSLYNQDDGEEIPTRSIVFGKSCALGVLCARFPVSMTTAQADLEKAKVEIFLDLSAFPGYTLVPVRIYRRRVDGSLSQDSVAEDTFNLFGSQRVTVEIPKDELKGWEEDGTVGLYFDATVEDTNVAVHPEQALNADQIPTVVLTMEKPKKRTRRASNEYCEPGSQDKGCCLHDMIIDFKKLGWNFIMAPQRYNAFMCRGDCNLNHHHLVRFGHSKLMRESKIGGDAHCCHPSDYESLKVIYTRADNEIVITRVPGMIARRCTCT